MFNLKESFVSSLGRDLTFTERTFIWDYLISLKTNPLIGTGYDSFWLGNRVKHFWESGYGGIMEAHNGYLEIYLNLGIIGLFLLGGVVASAYSRIKEKLIDDFANARFELAFLVIVLIYNFTESAFRQSSLMWYILLLLSVRYSNSTLTHHRVDITT